jgi:hypothetical protein
MNLLVYTSADELRRTMQDFIEYYNYRRYHEAIGHYHARGLSCGKRLSGEYDEKKSYAGGPNKNNTRLSSGCVTIWAAGTLNSRVNWSRKCSLAPGAKLVSQLLTTNNYCTELATSENTVLALDPMRRTVLITNTRMTASITAYSAMSCPCSSAQILSKN